MKKCLSLLLALLLLTGCGPDSTEESTVTTILPTEAVTEAICLPETESTTADPTETLTEAPAEAAVEINDGECSHDYEKTVVAPTQTAQGYTRYACRHCGYAYKSEYTARLPAHETEPVHQHSYERKVTTPPTCSYGGEATYTCSCGDAYKEAVPKNEHIWSEWVVTREPTATAYGKKVRTCELCNGGQEANIDPLPADDSTSHRHSYRSNVTKAATCTERGSIVYTCSCGDGWMDIIGAKGHSWGDWVENGSEKSRTCSECGAGETKAITNVCDENGWSHQMSDADLARVTRGAAYYNVKCLCGRHCHGSNRDEALANFSRHAAEKQWSSCGEIMAEWSGYYHEFPDSTYVCARCGTVAAYRRGACFSNSCTICYG